MFAVDSIFSSDAIYFYDVTTGSEIGSCSECGNADDFSWNPNNVNQFVAGKSSGRTVFVDPLNLTISPEVITGTTFFSFGDASPFSPDGQYIVLYDTDTAGLEVHNSVTKQEVATLPYTTTGAINHFQWLSDGIYLDLSRTDDAIIWDFVTNKVTHVTLRDSDIFWKPDSSLYLAETGPNNVYIYDATTGNTLATLDFSEIYQFYD